MTEQEARGKWCPHARVVVGVGGLIGNKVDPLCLSFEGRDGEFFQRMAKQACCIASECMMWRWEKTKGPVLKKTVYRYLWDIPGCPIKRPCLHRSATDAEWDAAWSEVVDKCRRLGVEIDVPDGWEPDGEGVTVFNSDCDDGNMPYWYRDFKRSSDPSASGYCGLAGKP